MALNVSLTQVTVTHQSKNGDYNGLVPYAKTLLLETSKFLDFYSDPEGSGTVFLYKEREDRQVPAVMYKTATTPEALEIKLLEAENNQFLYLEITEIVNLHSGKKERPTVQVRRVNIEQIIKGYDILIGEESTPTHSYLIVHRGPFEVLRYKTTHLINEIDAIASESFSISVSGS